MLGQHVCVCVFDREVDELVKLRRDDRVLERVLVVTLEVVVLEEEDVELLDLQLEGSSDFLGRLRTDARKMRDRCETRRRQTQEKATFHAHCLRFLQLDYALSKQRVLTAELW